MKDGATSAYDYFDCKPGSLEMCLKQFEVKSVFPTYYTRMVKDVQKEEFVFEPIDTEKYTIGIGARQYTTFLTHWDNCYDHIRHQLEEFVYGRKATLELSFDSSDSVLHLEQVHILDHTEKVGDGVRFKYQYYMRVEIESNEFAGMPNIVGYCDIDQTLRTLYEGFLRLALLHTKEADKYGDIPSCLVTYNRFKSPLIETCLISDYKPDYTSYRERQVHIKDILTIEPNYDYFIMHLDGTVEGYEDLEELCGQPVQIEGLKEWCREIASIIVEAAIGRTYPMDWEDYHRRGIALAKQLRAVLPKEYDLWYDAPYEDDSGIIEKPDLII